MATASKRKETDVIKLMMKDFKVDMPHDDMSQFYVEFHGPNESPYEGGVWRMRVDMPHTYPYDPPLVTFANMIYHPNVDQMIGAICLDVIKQSWTPAFDLVNVFEAFLPQLLLYPNPSDPLNKEAADLMMRDPPSYDAKVKEYCQRYAKPVEIVPPKDSDADELTEDEHSGDDQSASTSDPK